MTPAVQPSALIDQRARELLEALAGRLLDADDLRTEAWRATFTSVPRHLFLPRFYQMVHGTIPTLWHPVTADDPAWLESVYQDEALVTQLDGTDESWIPGSTESVTGAPTSSSTAPGQMMRMLEVLDVRDGHRVLEIGTGTGYNAALLARRAGCGNLITIDVDPFLVDQARERLAACGLCPTVEVGDGAQGWPSRAPFDRVIATCAVSTVPLPWIAQTRPGGLILATLQTSLHGYGLVQLTAAGDGSAAGRVLPEPASFMPMRSDAGPSRRRSTPGQPRCTECPQSGPPRPSRVSLAELDANAARFALGLALPGMTKFETVDSGEVRATRLAISVPDGVGSWAAYDHGTSMVTQGGPRLLWDELEGAYKRWCDVGRPTPDCFLTTVTREGWQILHLPGGELSHQLV